MMQIKDDYAASGNDYGSFLEELASFTENTSSDKMPNYKFKLLSYQGKEKDSFVFAQLDEVAITNFSNFITPPPKVKLTPKESERPFFEEMAATSGLMLIDEIENSLLFVSKDALPSLSDRAGIKGDLIQTYSLIRNLYIAQGLFSIFERANQKKNESAVITRSQLTKDFKTVKKAFAFMGKRFAYFSLNTLKSVCNQIMKNHTFPDAECISWKLTHQYGTISLEFPETAQKLKEKYGLKDTIIPGICLSDSDTGRQSFTVKLSFRFEGSSQVAYYHSKAWEHTSEFKTKDILPYIFLFFPQTIEQLVQLFAEKQTQKITKTKLPQVYDKVLKDAQFAKAIGKKRTLALAKNLVNNVIANPKTRPKSMYDVMKALMNSYEMVGDMPEYAQAKLCEACGRLPFFDNKGAPVRWES